MKMGHKHVQYDPNLKRGLIKSSYKYKVNVKKFDINIIFINTELCCVGSLLIKYLDNYFHT